MKKQLCVLETSFEAANKVGGIYTVLSSKALHAMKEFDEYCCIGPYSEPESLKRFEETAAPEKLKNVFNALEKEHGFKCHFGKWMIKGQPETILVEVGRFAEKTNEIKAQLWEKYAVDSLGSGYDFDQPVCWSKAVGILIQKMLEEKCFKSKHTIVHAHEWLAGTALLHLKEVSSNAKLAFTTHATFLGRVLSAYGNNLPQMVEEGLKKKQPAQKELAYKYNIQAKHLLEKAVAQNSDVFSTVSKNTARECEFILGRKPDIITPNGLDASQYPLMEELSDRHISYRNKIREFIFKYFMPHYNIDAKNTLFYMISGRHEIHNKGIDLFIEALSMLNQELKKEPSKKTVIAFIFVPTATLGRRREFLKNFTIFNKLEDLIDAESHKIKQKIIYTVMQGKMPTEAGLFEEEFLMDLKLLLLKVRSSKASLPPVSPFNLHENNEIASLLQKNNLLNMEEDKVKIIYYPDYLNPADGLLGMQYYNVITGCHLGIFPSLYEPWGYTPLETASLGLQTITTDLSGFGQFIDENASSRPFGSIEVLKVSNKKREETVSELFELMKKIYEMTKKQRISLKSTAKNLSELADWQNLIKSYFSLYELALSSKR